jgi:hypothetical protein
VGSSLGVCPSGHRRDHCLEFYLPVYGQGQPVMYQGSQEFAKFMKDGFAQYGQMIKEFNIKLE